MNTARPDEPRPVDEAVDRSWRAASNEVPGSRIDATILEAAHAEVNRDLRRPVDAGGSAAPRWRSWWTAWQPLAAAATVAGLAFVLVQTMPRDRDVAPPIAVEQAPPEAASESAGAPPAAASAESRDEPPTRSRAAAPAPAPAGIATQAERELGESQRAMESADFAMTPEAWAARVEELFAADDHAAAAAVLRAFRTAYADADRYLPEALRDWAGTVE